MDLLTTLADVKSYLDIADTATQSDEKLEALITAVSAYALNQAQMPDREDGEDPTFFSSYYRERYDGPGGFVLLLRHSAPTSPVTSVLAVVVDGVDIPRATQATQPGFVFDRFAVRLRGYRFASGMQNVEVRYLAGTEPDSATGEALKAAATEWVALIYKTRPHIDIRSKTLDRETISFFQSAMPVRMEAILNNLTNRMAAA